MDLRGLRAVVVADTTGIENGEWVIPSFFSPGMFVGMKSFRTCSVAEIAPGFDPDACVEAFTAQYPGIPARMLADMVTALCKGLLQDAPAEFTEGARVRAVGDVQSMSLVDTASQKIVQLWTNIDTSTYL